MTATVRYLTHPQVVQDPAIPVPDWPLNDVGQARVAALLNKGWIQQLVHIAASTERKARDTAEPIAARLNLTPEFRADMCENDRSATGYLPGTEFEAVADAFFAQPTASVRGWERAADAQARVVTATRAVLTTAPPGDILLIGHGAVGTLLFCHLSGQDIARRHDQPGGGGNIFAFDRATLHVHHGWQPMETAP